MTKDKFHNILNKTPSIMDNSFMTNIDIVEIT